MLYDSSSGVRKNLARRILKIAREIRRKDSAESIIDLAVEHGLSAYDAAYPELAKRNNYPLVTLDIFFEGFTTIPKIPFHTTFSLSLNDYPPHFYRQIVPKKFLFPA